MELTAVMPDDIRDLTGEFVTLVLTDDTRISGIMKGVNAKGVRIVPSDGGKETTRSLRRVSAVVTEEIEDTRTEADYESEVAAFHTDDVLNADVADEAETADDDVMDDTRNEEEYDFEGEMTVITMDGGAYIEADDIPDDVSEITDEGPALPGSVSTPRELADIFGTSAFAIRQALRALGLNVGKGKRYDLSSLTKKELTSIREKVMAK
ncbi:hypothetical protein [Glycomyces buryatensis]|uniref:Uncharacterized protein n=1 Tax=Glycomyces buryatensis TaxID=2570927 RepID=A0A4S8QG76_9ACTN|nr:hypothetical protein [Glycomyces buryatensis]THV42711.1 hypothetical protein FAB82_04820 [Glycomyces buryatensis]